MVDLQQVAGAAAAPADRVHVAAAPLIALPYVAPDGGRNRPAGRGAVLRCRSGSAVRVARGLRRQSARARRPCMALRRRSGGGCRLRSRARRGLVGRRQRRDRAVLCRLRRSQLRRSGALDRGCLRRRGNGVRVHRGPLHRRGSVAVRGCLVPRRRSSLGAPTASRPARVVAVEPLLDQPPHELPQRHVRIDVRQQSPELLQPALALRIDDRLQLPAPLTQRPHPVGRHRQRRIHRGQHLHHLARALADGLLHQRLPRRYVQHRRRLPLRGTCRRRAVRLRGRSHPGPHSARQVRSLPITAFEGGLQLRRRVQRERAVPQPLARPLDPRAQLHGVDPAPCGGIAVAEPARHVGEQARKAATQIQAARFDLEQVIDDEHLNLVVEESQPRGLLQQLVVGEAGHGAGELLFRSASHDLNIMQRKN